MARVIPFFSEKTAKDLVGLLGKKPGVPTGPGSYEQSPEERPLFRNDSGETVPAYGCMRVTGAALVDGRYVTLIAKPNGSGAVFLFNGPNECLAGKLGTAQGTKVVRCYYTSGTVTAGDLWGPGSTWTISASGTPKAVTVHGTIVSNEILLASQFTNGDQVLVKAPSGGIPKRVGTLLGSATCDVWDADATTGQLADTTTDITVKNWATSITCANGDRYGWAEFYDGIWWIVSEDCSDAGSDTVSAAFSVSGSSFELPYSTGDTTSAAGQIIGHEIGFTFTGTIA